MGALKNILGIFPVIWALIMRLVPHQDAANKIIDEERDEAEQELNKPRPSDDTILTGLQHPDKPT